MTENTVKLGWNLLCGKCRKRAVKMIIPKAKRYLREHPGSSINMISRIYGIPKSTLHDALNKENNNPSVKTPGNHE